jgi:hypothetical protein
MAVEVGPTRHLPDPVVTAEDLTSLSAATHPTCSDTSQSQLVRPASQNVGMDTTGTSARWLVRLPDGTVSVGVPPYQPWRLTAPTAVQRAP